MRRTRTKADGARNTIFGGFRASRRHSRYSWHFPICSLAKKASHQRGITAGPQKPALGRLGTNKAGHDQRHLRVILYT